MKRTLLALTALASTTSMAHAVGLDRSGQRIGVLFETGNHVELRFGFTSPSLDGVAIPLAGGAPTGNVADDFLIVSGGIKFDVNDKLSFAIIGDEPYGLSLIHI